MLTNHNRRKLITASAGLAALGALPGLARAQSAPDNLRTDPLSWPGALTFPVALARAIRARRAGWDAYAAQGGLR